jgi:hypothetical protein
LEDRKRTMVEWHQPDKTPEDIQDILRTRVDKDIADEDFASYIKRYVKQNDEILNNLGSDYDENGIPYWLKTTEQTDVEKDNDSWEDDGGLAQRGYNSKQIEGRDNV